ncbi:MAG: hypothetical protein IPO63_04185 [Bacteroidetes bacterium]|nr:hypothetical protein [Bacteroidota bacterium]
MAINKNHEFEELNGIKCCIVERAVSMDRVNFIKPLLEGNGYTVVVSGIIPKVPAPAPVAEGESPAPPPPPAAPTEFTIGVTDMCYNTINAIFGRFLRTREGKVVTLAYWQQKDEQAQDVSYFEFGS